MTPTNIKSRKRFSLGSHKKFLLISVLISAVLVSFIVLTSVLVVKHYARKSNLVVDNDTKVKIVPRSAWIAQPPSKPLATLHIPVPLVIISETKTGTCLIEDECIHIIKLLQTQHLEFEQKSDISYNFLIGGDGSAYEGRSWKKQGDYSLQSNSKSIGIALIGAFAKNGPSKKEISATQKLIKKGIRLGVIAKNYQLMGHTDLLEPSGEGLLKSLMSWPNWGGTVE